MKRGIFFDLGKVLLDFSLEPFKDELVRGSDGQDSEQIQAILNRESWFDRYEKGELDDDAFFDGLIALTGYRGSEDKLRSLWTDIFSPIPENIELARALKEDFPVGLISNTSPLHIAHVIRNFDVLDIFDVKILSYEVGMAKPDPAIFQLALDRLGVEASGSVFIDDLEANLEGARALGMHVIHYRPGVNLSEDLRHILE